MVGGTLLIMARTNKKCEARNMLSRECAYVGAMLDAEGCIRKEIVHRKNTSLFVKWGFHLGNSEVELISAILRATGIGRIHSRISSGVGFIKRYRKYKRLWIWDLYAYNDVVALIKQLLPYSLKAQKLQYFMNLPIEDQINIKPTSNY